jgi:hypothetical protein
MNATTTHPVRDGSVLSTATHSETFRKDAKIQWYRCQVDPKLTGELMKCSDFEGFKQALGHPRALSYVERDAGDPSKAAIRPELRIGAGTVAAPR